MRDNRLPVRLEPAANREYRNAITAGGGSLTRGDAAALVWSKHGGPEELGRLLGKMPSLQWVQLPSAGVDNFLAAGVLDPGIVWTSAKGSYAKPVAEHALALTLALLRDLQTRARALTWGEQTGRSLYGRKVLLLGGGGIAKELAALMRPFGVRLTVCRRSSEPVEFADRTIDTSQFIQAAADTDILVLAAPLSEATRGIVDSEALGAMRPDAVIINVGRGALVVTDDLVRALNEQKIAGAALDVTDPEPLPDGHPLWRSPRALISPHSADTERMIVPLLAERIRENVARFSRGERLIGVVNLAEGY